MRSTVCRLANSFVTAGYSRSDAFKMAWKLVKSNAVVKVAGVTHENRQSTINALVRVENVSFILYREADNAFDSKAVAVAARANGKIHKLGYIPRKVAALLAPVMDNGIDIHVTSYAIVGGYGPRNYGLRLQLAA